MLRLWDRLALPAQVCILVGAAAALFGLLQTVTFAAHQVAAARQPELGAREQTWGPVYGFGRACAAAVPARGSVLLVDPTGQDTGTDRLLPGAAPDADWSNGGHFAYALYPRRVELMGRVPADWDPATAGTGYVALWRQAAFRPVAARDAGAGAEAKLAASPGLTRVCTYTDHGGNSGAVYAAAGTAGAAAGPVGDLATPWSWHDYLPALLGLASLWLIGAAILRLLAGSWLPGALVAALALPLGGFAAATQLLVYSEAGLSWSAPIVGAPWLLLLGLVAWRERSALLGLRRPGELAARAAAGWRALPVDQRLALGALAGLVALTAVVAPLSLPFSDGIDFYYSRARAFFLDGGLVPSLLRGHDLPFTAPAHPPLVPLCVAWLYLFVGRVNEHASLLWWPATYASLVAAFYALVRTRLSGRVAAWYSLAFAAAGYDLALAAMAGSYADLALALDLLAACGLAALWLGAPSPSPRLLVLAALFLAAAALTKEEGLVLAVVLAAALAAVIAFQRRRLWRHLGAAAAVFAAASLPLLWLRLRYPQPELTVSGHVQLGRLPLATVVTVYGMGARAAVRWGAVLVLVVAAVLLLRPVAGALRRRLDAAFWLLPLFFAGALAVYGAAMVLDPRDLTAELSHTAGRLLDQVLPVPFLAGAWLIAGALGEDAAWRPRLGRTPRPAPGQPIHIAR